MNRRSFIGKLALAGAAIALPLPRLAAAPAPRTLKDCGVIGDGVHDDTQALQKALDYGIPICGGTFAVSNTLHGRQGGVILNSVFRWIGPMDPDTAMFSFPVSSLGCFGLKTAT